MKNKVKILPFLLAGGCLVWAGWQNNLVAGIASARVPRDQLDQDAIRILEEHIPFGMRTPDGAGPHCDPLDLVVLVQVDDQDREISYRWRVMDGFRVQLECEDFYDLYYRCDAPGCYHVRVIKERLSDGRMLSTRQGHVCRF